MTETIVKLAGFAGLFISLFAAFWVWKDANRLKEEGAEVNPIAWVALVLLIWPVGLPLYLLSRCKRSRSSPSPEGVVSPEFLGLGVIAFLVAITLSMVVTWILVARYPVPDDDAIVLGLVGFFFVVFFDLFLIYFVIRPEIRKGQRIEAAQLSVWYLVVGLLVASLVGVLPWCFRWLINHNPWVLSLLQYSDMMWVIAVPVWIWHLWRVRRRSTEPGSS